MGKVPESPIGFVLVADFSKKAIEFRSRHQTGPKIKRQLFIVVVFVVRTFSLTNGNLIDRIHYGLWFTALSSLLRALQHQILEQKGIKNSV